MGMPNKKLPNFAQANAVSTPQLVERLGIKINRAFQILCPFHQEKTPSCKVYPEHVHCFACGRHGSNIDIVMAALGLKNAVEAAEIILKGNIKQITMLKSANKEKDAKAAAEAAKALKIAQFIYQNATPLAKHSQALAVWREWGFAELTGEVFGIRVAHWGGCERILIPDFRCAKFHAETGLLADRPEDYLIGLTGRRLNENKMHAKYHNVANLPMRGFLLETYKHCKPAKVVICEGQKDAMAAYELGLHAVGLCGQNIKVLDDLMDAEWLLYTDQDDSGFALETKIKAVAQAKGKKLTRLYLGVGKDLCDGLAFLKLKPPCSSTLQKLEDTPECFGQDGNLIPGPVIYGEFAKLMQTAYAGRKP